MKFEPTKPLPTLKTLSTYPVDVLEISHSTMLSADDCMRKLEFSKFFKYNLRTSGLAGTAGNVLHDAFGAYLISRLNHKSKEEGKALANWELVKKYPIELCKNPLWKWSLEQCYGGLLNLINWFDKNPHLELAEINGKPAVEVPFHINIIHGISNFLPVVYRGYIDFVFYNTRNDSFFVLDLKNTNIDAADFTPHHKYSPQCLPYSLVLSAALGEDFSNLEVQYLISKLDLLNPKISLLDFDKTTKDVQDWTKDLYLKLVNIKTYWESQWFPRKGSGCVAWNKTCKFFELCGNRDIKTINLFLNSLQQEPEREFNPWITLDLEIN